MHRMIEIAQELAEEFRGRAAEYDRTGEFPHANYDRMRETGYLRGIVPEELGGLGASLPEAARAQEELARGDGATAIAVNMHQFQVGVMADGFRNGAPTEATLRRIANEGIILGSTGAEMIVAGDWSPAATAERDGDDYIINGRKYFCSQATGMNVVRVNARDTATDELLAIAVPATAPGVSIAETWDTTGMRASASHDLILENVRVPATNVGVRVPYGAPMRTPQMTNVGRWFLPLGSSVYLGIAGEAREHAYRAIGGGINSANRADPLTDMLVGQMEAAYFTAQAVRNQTAAELATPPADHQAGLATGILCKEIVTAKAIEVVEKAVELAGGRAYYRKSPLERLSRDVRAGRFHPPASPTSFQMAGERRREAFAAAEAATRELAAAAR